MCNEIKSLHELGKKILKTRLEQAVSLKCLTTDIWSKPGLTSSYLGVTINFISVDGKLERAVLDLVHFPSPHTGDAIGSLITSVINDWELKGTVAFVITDNASSMIKAFKQIQKNSESSEQEDELISNTDATSITDKQNEETPLTPNHKNSPLTTRTARSSVDGIPDLRSEEEFISENTIENDEVEFLEEEPQIEMVLRQGNLTGSNRRMRLKRLSCFSHTLQLVMGSFDKFRNPRNDFPRFATVIKSAIISHHRKLVSSFNSSTVATPRLIQLANQKLVNDVSTRWSSTFLLLDQLLKLRPHVIIVYEELGWDGLLNSDWSTITTLTHLLEPFTCYTQLVGASKTPTVSSVVPTIIELQLHLEVHYNSSPGLKGVTSKMITEMKRRFDYMFNEENEHFQPIYLLATALDPNLRLFLTDEQNRILLRHVDKVSKEMGIVVDNENECCVSEESSTSDSFDISVQNNDHQPYKDLEPTSFKLLLAKTVAHLSRNRRRNHPPTAENQGSRSPITPIVSKIEDELAIYLAKPISISNSSNNRCKQAPLDIVLYWKENASKFPNLSRLAFTLAAIQATSTESERLFSAGGWHVKGKKNRLEKEQLAEKVFLSCNKTFLRPLLFQ